MKLGFVSAIVPEWSFEQVLEFAARHHFQCVELMCWPVGKAERRFAGTTHVDVVGFTQTKADDVNAQCARHGVSISGLGYYPNLLDPDPAVTKKGVEHLKKVIRATKLLGLDVVTSFVGRDWTKTIDANWPRFLKVWRPLISFAEDHGIRIAIENCPMSFTQDEWPGGKNLAVSPAVWRRMFSDIPSKNFGLNYDPSHFILQGMDPLSPLKEFKEKLFHLHAKDVAIEHAKLNEVGVFAFPKEWHKPRIPGFGDIDWAHYMARLYEIGYAGPICIEVEDDTFGRDLEGRQRAVIVAGNVLRPYLA